MFLPRRQFPILTQKVNSQSLIYFDNGATTQKPQGVIDAMQQYYEQYNSNIHRGVHYLSQLATEKYEETRIKAQSFIQAKYLHEIITGISFSNQLSDEKSLLIIFGYEKNFKWEGYIYTTERWEPIHSLNIN